MNGPVIHTNNGVVFLFCLVLLHPATLHFPCLSNDVI